MKNATKLTAKRGSVVSFCGLACLFFLTLPGIVHAAVLTPIVPGIGPPQKVEDANDEGVKEEGKYVGGAALKTDPDLVDRLSKADDFKKDGSFRAASRLWQSVLGESGDILYTEDEETYYALTERVESILADLPPAGLSAYRIAADAAAREILAQRQGDFDLETLSRVVKGYFLSSFGDDAAYQLACIYLDNYDFVGAARLLRKITEQYPDPTVSLSEVWMRIALAYAYIGDSGSAQSALASAEQAGADPESRLYEAIQKVIAESPQIDPANTVDKRWSSRWGNAKRLGQMPALPQGYGEQGLAAVWQYSFEPREFYLNDNYEGVTIPSFDESLIQDSLTSAEKSLIASWREGKWRPAGNLLFADNAVVFKTGADLTVWNRELEKEPLWRPLWLNQFVIDDATAAYKRLFDNYRYEDMKSPGKVQKTKREIQLFGDQIAQAMSIHRGVLYNVEGPEYSWHAKKIPFQRRTSNNPYGSVPRRTRVNRLAAYNFETGKILWSIPSTGSLASTSIPKVKNTADGIMETAEEKPFENVGFMGAPVGFGDLLLVPVNVSGSIFLYALDSQQQGALVWKSFLCDEPGGGSQPWSPIHLAIEGSTAYVNCGTGVVFALDPMTGSIRYARRYPRTGETNNYLARFGGNAEMLELDGWQEDVVIPIGNELIMLASDYSVVWAIDRQTAEFRWKTDNRPFGKKYEYLIGANEDYLFLGSSNSIAAVSVRAQGRWEWVYDLEGETSFGRAMLTEDAIYVPVGKHIVKLGLGGKQGEGDVQAVIPVRLGLDVPLGNLYSDGQRIWVVGANRLYALGEFTAEETESSEPSTDEEPGKEGDSTELSLDAGPKQTISAVRADEHRVERATLPETGGAADDTPSIK